MQQGRNYTYYGWRVVAAAFALAAFGMGMGFHGPAIYLHALQDRTGWPLALISTAVTVHFLVGAVVVANLPRSTVASASQRRPRQGPSRLPSACWVGRTRFRRGSSSSPHDQRDHARHVVGDKFDLGDP